MQDNLFGNDVQDECKDDLPPTKRVNVLVPLPVDRPYTYALPRDVDHIANGMFVKVNVGPRVVTGVVWGGEPDMAVSAKRIKPVLEIMDCPPLPAEHRIFLERTARYTTAPLGAVLKMTLTSPASLEAPKTVKLYAVPGDAGIKPSTPKRQRALDALRSHGWPMRPAQLSEASGVSTAVLKAMANAGELLERHEAELPPCIKPKISSVENENEAFSLSEDQQDAADEMVHAVQADTFQAILLDGVTGSGKTEVYFEAVTQALRQGKQALIMLPEIALSNAFLDRFEARFGCAPALWHSALTPAQRRKVWRGVIEGKTKVVIGARSALYLPFPSLGAIVVDEEHDPAFKQETGVLYHARDMAVMRAHIHNIPIILVSATPSLETIHNVVDGRYEHLVLPSRYGGAEMPEMSLVDMKEEKLPRTEFISQTLRDAIVETFVAGRQTLLFLNRRGYAPLTLCRGCGHRYECPQCTAWLVEHRFRGHAAFLQCHHCGYSGRVPEQCTECGAEDSLVPCGPGVERIEEEVKALFPQMRTLVLTSDTTEEDDSLFSALEQIRAGAVDIIIGTQIIAKGHHFPNLTCVGVVDADLGLKGGDLRASERTWQMLHQVAGRAGRAEHKGHVYIQTFMPDNRLMQALSQDDRDGFLEIELDERKLAYMPPYSRLAGIIISAKDEGQAESMAKALAQSAPHGDGVRVLGPAPAPMYMLRGRYRYRFLVQADKRLDLQTSMRHWVQAIKPPSSDVRVQIDIDPQSFF